MFHIKGKSSFFPLYYNNILHVLRVFVKWLLPFLSQMIPISGIKKIFADAMNKASSKTAEGTFSFFVPIYFALVGIQLNIIHHIFQTIVHLMLSQQISQLEFKF